MRLDMFLSAFAIPKHATALALNHILEKFQKPVKRQKATIKAVLWRKLLRPGLGIHTAAPPKHCMSTLFPRAKVQKFSILRLWPAFRSFSISVIETTSSFFYFGGASS
jgi:hypothetical protein